MSSLDGNPRGRAVFIVTTTTFILASLFVAARLVSRFWVLKTRTADDWCMILAWCIAFGLSFAIDYGCANGLGRHDVDIPAEWLPSLRSSEYAFTILYNPALMVTKTSILIFYLRLSRNTQTLLRVASYITLGLVNVAGVVLTFFNAFQCSPPNAAYDPLKTSDHCLSIVTLYLCSAPVNIFTDLAILILPIPVLTGMRLPQRQKTVLVFTFTLGIFVTIVDVIRIYFLQKAATNQSNIAQAKLGTEVDFAWNASTAFMWSAVEVNIGMICACIPTLKPLIKRIHPAMIKDTRDGTEKTASFSSHAQVDPNNHRHSESSIVDPTEPAPAHSSESDEMDFMEFLSGGSKRRPLSQQKSSTLGPKNPAPAHMNDPTLQMDMMDFLTTPATPGGGIEPGSFTRPKSLNSGPIEPAPTHTHDPELQPDSLDFLTTPATLGGGIKPGSFHRPATAHTQATENTVYFGFVNMRRPKSMLKTRGMESFKYCAIVTILFFLWGFSYGLLNTLNNEIAILAGQTEAQALGLTTAYFGSYFFGALTVGQWLLRHVGFKATFISGLCIYGTGTLMFWPSAVLLSYPGFIISQFVVAFGLSVLETAANPFIALCGPAQYAEYRLLLSQAVQGTASICSQVLAEKVLFNAIFGRESLIDVQWTYLAIALFTVMLALFFYYMPLPEASDTDLQLQAESLEIYPDQSVLPSLPRIPLIYVSLGLAVIAQFLYVAAQESMSVFFSPLLQSLQKKSSLALTSDNYTLLGHGLFAVSRFLFAPLTLFVPPRILLLFSFIAGLILAIVTQSLSISANGIAGPALMFFFFEGPIFPLIYAIGLRGMGRHAKWAAAALTAACCGGGIYPFAMYAVQRLENRDVQYSYCVIIALFAFGSLYPIYLNLLPGARWQVDPRSVAEDLGEAVDGDQMNRRPSMAASSTKKFSRRFSDVYGKMTGGKVGKMRNIRGQVEHREVVERVGSSS